MPTVSHVDSFYQRGVYAGVYPDKLEAAKIIEQNGNDVEISTSEEELKFRINNKAVEVNGTRNWDLKALDSCKTARVAIVDNELIVIKLSLCLHTQVVYLADKYTGKIFAIYEYSDDANR